MVSPEVLLASLEALSERKAAQTPIRERLRQDERALRTMDAKVNLILSQRRKDDATHR